MSSTREAAENSHNSHVVRETHIVTIVVHLFFVVNLRIRGAFHSARVQQVCLNFVSRPFSRFGKANISELAKNLSGPEVVIALKKYQSKSSANVNLSAYDITLIR